MRYIITALLCTLLTPVLGQKQIAEISLLGSRVWDVQAFQVGDSLFVAYEEPGADGVRKKSAIWIAADGHVEKLRFDELRDVALMDVIRKNDIIYYYVMSEKKGLVTLEAIEENRTLRKREKVNTSISLPGDFLASFVKGRLMHVVCYDRERGKIVIHVLSGRDVTGKHDIVTVSKKFLGREGFEFFDNRGFTNASRGNLGIKAVFEGDVLSLSIDHAEKDRTKIVRVSIPDFVIDSLSVKYQPEENSSSQIHKEHLYRVSGNRQDMFLEVFRLSDGKRITLQPFSPSRLPENASYSREGDKNEIAKEKNFKLTGAMGVVDFSMVTESDDQYNYLRLGSHTGEKSSFVPVGTNAFQIYLGNSLGNAIRNNDNTPGINKYFYVRESKDHSAYQLIVNPNDFPDCQRADEHEIVLEKGYRVTYKAYVRSSNGSLIGIYCLKKKLIFVQY